MNFLTQDYYIWLQNIQTNFGQNHDNLNEVLSKIPNTYNSVQQLSIEFIRKDVNVFVKVNHTENHRYDFTLERSWDDLISEFLLSKNDKKEFLKSYRILYAPCEAGIVLIGYDINDHKIIDVSG